ncbi:hypothetical protein B0T10DRAFT_544727 [Thelonectria olida]|uniref:NmrA-like domain-containing protein n=1 Tax=Thelonectria olida TaxID=1576542 RepID=A0A9P9AVQ6_9HYPO|nr:hypothetical protein B0T10DRAFT_544727 [Thelonectria olida]
MSDENRIAVISHRGWLSSAIVEALAAACTHLKVLYRPGSDISGLPANVTAVEVDLEDHGSLVAAFQDINIVVSLCGHGGVARQQAFVKAIQRSPVQLFSPSDFAARYDEQGLRIPVNKNKDDVERAAHEAGIPTTVVLPGNLAEFALNTRAMGVDLAENKLIFMGNSAEEQINLCTRPYVAAAFASIFAHTPISQLKNRAIGLSELRVTGKELAEVLEKKHGKPPTIFRQGLSKVNEQVETLLRDGSPFALAWYCRKIWGTGQQVEMVGEDIWEVPNFHKATLEDLIVGGKLGQYRAMPAQIDEFFRGTFFDSEQ